jgi:hypothetical protein
VTTARAFAYRVDAEDRLQWVSPDWVDFARQNQAPQLTTEAVLGQPLFAYITGQETEQIYRLILDRVRRTRTSTVVPFRCDGPGVRRFMELSIQSGSSGELCFEGRLLREEERMPVDLFDPDAMRSDRRVSVCSWCKRVDAAGEWVEVELAVGRLGLFDSPVMPQLLHGMCPDCVERVLAEAGVND